MSQQRRDLEELDGVQLEGLGFRYIWNLQRPLHRAPIEQTTHQGDWTEPYGDEWDGGPYRGNRNGSS